ncbi:hypothetical protein F3J27_09185 [Enterobacter sp. Ap-916]|uniref:hypothetical protein n=1 Tax=unclassified Enterobacter TaxID=2608935 RepID=UPI00141F5BCF|nr:MULTISPECIES: hypothetical protein [unclassified Enterobacter]NIF58930.1 hypothetical protein [Enterobacter sp. Ap-867]NIG29654.1 hypothetical protein [Enterobacter sp. Ap-916]
MNINKKTFKSFIELKSFFSYRSRAYNLIVIIVFAFVFIRGVGVVFDIEQIDRSKLIALFNDNIGVVVALSFGIVTAGFLISYVNKGIGGSKDGNKESLAFVKLKEELSALKISVEQLSQLGANESNSVDLEPAEKAKLIEAAKKRIVGNTLLAADVSLKNDIKTLKHQIDINRHYSDIVYRLESEIDRLNRRGGVNLVIGAVIALIGISYLGFTVTNQLVNTDKVDYIIHMAPRLSFVIVIELFAYFFLKLYKNGFDEVKYFQNELTNIDSKVLGIKFLKDIKNEELMGEVIKSLMATERNFILEKGQSTVSLEQQKIKNEEDRKTTEIIKELFKLRK